MALARSSAVLALAAVLLASCGGGEQAPAPPTTTGSPAPRTGEATITGEVLENHRGCRLDGPCALRLRTEDGEVRVVYHFGEHPPCRNADAVRAGDAVQEGDRVEVRGRWQGSGARAVLTTCDPGSAIRVI